MPTAQGFQSLRRPAPRQLCELRLSWSCQKTYTFTCLPSFLHPHPHSSTFITTDSISAAASPLTQISHRHYCTARSFQTRHPTPTRPLPDRHLIHFQRCSVAACHTSDTNLEVNTHSSPLPHHQRCRPRSSNNVADVPAPNDPQRGETGRAQSPITRFSHVFISQR